VLASTLQFVFIVFRLSFLWAEAVACMSTQVIYNFYEPFIVHFIMANKFDLI